ncbi:MAG: acyl-CoA dehydrogenase family protein [Thermoleophilaceae bacterium]|nr:acyl-CoA dehydrogenase family protein [Thermoleophilaceae bacterium]
MSELTAEQRDIRELARRFADERIAPNAGRWDREHRFPRELYDEMGELGLMGVCVPEAYGGAGADYFAYVLVLEELSRADASVGVTLAVHLGAGMLPILNWATDEQKQRYVPPLASGQELCAFALTEPEVGSDASSLRARVVDGRITGTKQWVTNGSYASTFTVFAREHDVGVSAFLVRRDAEGFSVTREEEKMGLNASSTADLALDAVPGERLGPPGAGMRIALSTLDSGRIGIGAQAVGIAQAALELATSYAKERHAFGGPIGRFQAIQHKLADMQTEIEAARALVWRAARIKDAGLPHTVEGAQAKLFASRVARFQTGEALQVLGGYGYTKEFPAERYYRDAKVTEIYEGTSEIQRLVIAQALLGEVTRA